MIIRLFKKLLRFFRSILGTEQIRAQLKGRFLYQRLERQKMILALGNALKYSAQDPNALKETITYQRCNELLSLLSPMDVEGGNYVRIGRENDGGYVMLENFDRETCDAAYSFGINDDVSWDEQMANRGIDVYMYDHTISDLPIQHPKFHYFQTGVTGHKKGENLKTLGDLIIENGHTKCKNLILKMDIEGSEWDVLEEISPEVIKQFSQIAIEFHGLSNSVYSDKCESIARVLKKINETHQSVHVHANSTGIPIWIGKLVLPAILEVTYVRRADMEGRLIQNSRQFPTKIDQPTFKNSPDMYLGNFFEEEVDNNSFSG